MSMGVGMKEPKKQEVVSDTKRFSYIIYDTSENSYEKNLTDTENIKK